VTVPNFRKAGFGFREPCWLSCHQRSILSLQAPQGSADSEDARWENIAGSRSESRFRGGSTASHVSVQPHKPSLHIYVLPCEGPTRWVRERVGCAGYSGERYGVRRSVNRALVGLGLEIVVISRQGCRTTPGDQRSPIEPCARTKQVILDMRLSFFFCSRDGTESLDTAGR